jgi:hypothetical protein
LAPRIHRPGLVGVAATVEISGPLDHPEFRPLRGSLVTSALSSFFSNALRPVEAITDFRIIGSFANVDWLRSGAAKHGNGKDPCDAVVRRRVEQLKTSRAHPIDPGDPT